MATLVFAMNVSLDGYVDHEALPVPGPALFRHWTEHVRGLAGSIYGRRMYGLMRYWDEDRPEWDAAERAFALAWRALPKWVASRGAVALGPNASLIAGDVAAAVRDLKARLAGELSVSGPVLAGSLAALIDQYRLYLHAVVLGAGNPFFAAAPRPPLRLAGHDRIDDDVVRLTYVPR